jgi:hypothetical protein
MAGIERRRLSGGRLKEACYDAQAQRLEISFVDGSQKTYLAVQPEVWRRLIASPNPATFYEDRIEEEYVVSSGRATGGGNARAKLDSLFGTSEGGD